MENTIQLSEQEKIVLSKLKEEISVAELKLWFSQKDPEVTFDNDELMYISYMYL